MIHYKQNESTTFCLANIKIIANILNILDFKLINFEQYLEN